MKESKYESTKIMEAMYTMSIDIHFWGIIFLLVVIVANGILLNQQSEVQSYATKMRRLMPVSTSLLFLTLFTGTVMMAAKHLEFSVENIVMILFAIIYIILEVYRYKLLKRSARDAYETYKDQALKILGIELFGTLLITGWMVV